MKLEIETFPLTREYTELERQARQAPVAYLITYNQGMKAVANSREELLCFITSLLK